MSTDFDTPFDAADFASRLAGISGLDEKRARACADLVEAHILARLATKSDLAAFEARMGETADILFKHLAEAMQRLPDRTRDSLRSPLRRHYRALHIGISQIKGSFWSTMLLAAIMSAIVSSVIARLL